MDTTNIKKVAAGTAMAGVLGFGIMGVSSGIAAAKPGHEGPHGPGVSAPADSGDDHGNGHGNGNDNGNGNDQGEFNGRWNGWNGWNDGDGWNGGEDGNSSGAWLPGMPPGQNPFGPPGQVKQMATLNFTSALDVGNGLVIPAGTVLPNPFRGLPPGQWAGVNLANVVTSTVPNAIGWLLPNSGLTAPLPLAWNAATNQWGVTVNGVFTPYPIQFPAPVGG